MKFIFFILYKIIKFFIKKPTIKGIQYLQKLEGPFIFVANHEKSWGPIISYLFLPYSFCPWVIADITLKKNCRKYIEKDFVNKELKIYSPLSKIISYVIEFFTIPLMRYIEAIPVYCRSKKLILDTIRLTLENLKNGKNILIFPEENVQNSEILKEFQRGFIKIPRFYYENTKKNLIFVPLVLNKKLNVIEIKKPLFIDFNNEFNIEKEKILKTLREEILSGLIN